MSKKHKKIALIYNRGDPPDDVQVLPLEELIKTPHDVKLAYQKYLVESIHTNGIYMDDDFIYCVWDDGIVKIDVNTSEAVQIINNINYD